MMEKSKLRSFTLKDNSLFRYWLYTLLLIGFGSSSIQAQSNGLHSVNPLDDYAILRDMAVTSPPSEETSPLLKYEINSSQSYQVQYFLGDNTFTIKSVIDIYNRTINAKLEIGNPKTYQYARSRIDSFYLNKPGVDLPIHKYYYFSKEDVYGKVIHQGKFTLVECYYIDVREGITNPLLSSGKEEDRLTVKKVPYLVDSGLWFAIPKKKSSLLEFIRKHYRKSMDKKKLKIGSSVDVLKQLN